MIRDLGSGATGRVHHPRLADRVLRAVLPAALRDRVVAANKAAKAIPAQTSTDASPDVQRPSDTMAPVPARRRADACWRSCSARSASSPRSCSRPRRPSAAKAAPYECGIVPEPRAAGALPGQLLPRRDAVHHVRHRDHLPLPVRRARGSSSARYGVLGDGRLHGVFFAVVRVRGRQRRARLGPAAAGPPAHRRRVSAERTLTTHDPPRRHRRPASTEPRSGETSRRR